MEEMMQQYDVMGDFPPRQGRSRGQIVDTQEDGWLVDVGYKCEGFLPRKEWTHRVLVEETPEPENGAKVRVQITNIGQGEDAQPRPLPLALRIRRALEQARRRGGEQRDDQTSRASVR